LNGSTTVTDGTARASRAQLQVAGERPGLRRKITGANGWSLRELDRTLSLGANCLRGDEPKWTARPHKPCILCRAICARAPLARTKSNEFEQGFPTVLLRRGQSDSAR
jgi:hypothetical protein